MIANQKLKQFGLILHKSALVQETFLPGKLDFKNFSQLLSNWVLVRQSKREDISAVMTF